MELCEMCGHRPAECTHHLIFGWDRARADEDHLTLRLCNHCHNMSTHPSERIHDNPAAEKLSKMLGQAIWESRWLEQNGGSVEDARANFRKRYSKSFL